jgi:hypothetical protein
VGEAANVAPDGTSNTLVEHWNGRRWAMVPSPDVATPTGQSYDHLFSVTVTSRHDAWAVGTWNTAIGIGGGGDHAMIEHWNGQRWVISQPGLGIHARNYLLAVTARSASDAWAMGDQRLPTRVLLVHWDGAHWAILPAPSGSLTAATTLPTGDVWAVGSTSTHPRTLAMHCTR